jgi:hypothetical protein
MRLKKKPADGLAGRKGKGRPNVAAFFAPPCGGASVFDWHTHTMGRVNRLNDQSYFQEGKNLDSMREVFLVGCDGGCSVDRNSDDGC